MASCSVLGCYDPVMDDSAPANPEVTLATSAETVTLDRKISRAIHQGKGIRLSAEQLDLLVEIGLMDVLSKAKAAALATQARQRRAPRAEIGQPPAPPPPAPPVRTAAEQRKIDTALARALRAVGRLPGEGQRRTTANLEQTE